MCSFAADSIIRGLHNHRLSVLAFKLIFGKRWRRGLLLRVIHLDLRVVRLSHRIGSEDWSLAACQFIASQALRPVRFGALTTGLARLDDPLGWAGHDHCLGVGVGCDQICLGPMLGLFNVIYLRWRLLLVDCQVAEMSTRVMLLQAAVLACLLVQEETSAFLVAWLWTEHCVLLSGGDTWMATVRIVARWKTVGRTRFLLVAYLVVVGGTRRAFSSILACCSHEAARCCLDIGHAFRATVHSGSWDVIVNWLVGLGRVIIRQFMLLLLLESPRLRSRWKDVPLRQKQEKQNRQSFVSYLLTHVNHRAWIHSYSQCGSILTFCWLLPIAAEFAPVFEPILRLPDLIKGLCPELYWFWFYDGCPWMWFILPGGLLGAGPIVF